VTDLMHDAITIAQASILGEYDVPPTAVVLANGNNVQLVLGGFQDESDATSWQDALRAIREELDAPAVMLYFSPRGQPSSATVKTIHWIPLIVQVGTPDACSSAPLSRSAIPGRAWSRSSGN